MAETIPGIQCKRCGWKTYYDEDDSGEGGCPQCGRRHFKRIDKIVC